jgi:hypothetical protein
MVGASTIGLGDVRLATPAIAVWPQNPHAFRLGSMSTMIYYFHWLYASQCYCWRLFSSF